MLSQAFNSLVKFAASTSVGQQYGIKPLIQAKIKELADSIDEFESEMDEIESLQKREAKDLKKTLKELVDASKDLIKDLQKAENLDPLVKIIGDHVQDYDDIEKYQEAVLDSKGLADLLKYFNKLVDIKNYEQLSEDLVALQEFESLSKKKQGNLIKRLESGDLVADISAENKRLKPEDVKKTVQELVEKLCRELKLQKQETKQLMKIFKNIVTTYLDTFNESREKLIEQLPVFLDLELKRVSSLKTEHKEPKKETKKRTKSSKDEVDVANEALEVDSKKSITHAHHGRMKISGGTKPDSSSNQAKPEPEKGAKHPHKKKRVD